MSIKISRTIESFPVLTFVIEIIFSCGHKLVLPIFAAKEIAKEIEKLIAKSESLMSIVKKPLTEHQKESMRKQHIEHKAIYDECNGNLEIDQETYLDLPFVKKSLVTVGCTVSDKGCGLIFIMQAPYGQIEFCMPIEEAKEIEQQLGKVIEEMKTQEFPELPKDFEKEK